MSAPEIRRLTRASSACGDRLRREEGVDKLAAEFYNGVKFVDCKLFTFLLYILQNMFATTFFGYFTNLRSANLAPQSAREETK